MMRAVLIFVLVAGFSALAQDPQRYDLESLDQVRSALRLENSGHGYANLLTPLGSGAVTLVVPESLEPSKEIDILRRWGAFKAECPNCAVGGTLGGPVVTGGNDQGSEYAPLFPPTDPCGGDDVVTISRAEYERLMALSATVEQKGKPGQ